MSEPTPSPRGDLNLLVGAVLDYAIFMLDPSGVVVSWNAGAEQIKGYRAEEIIGSHFSVFYPPEDVAAGKPGRELADAVTDGRLEDEGWRIRQDGSRFWANVVITPLFDDAGGLRGFAKVTRDMTERRAAEEKLRESEERFRLLVQGVLDYAIFMLDPSGVVVSWNTGAEQIKGYRAEEIIGRHFSVFYPPEDVAADKPGLELTGAVAHGRLEDEGWRIRQDGSRFWANVVITALFDDAGRLRGFAKVTRDMTERRAADRERTERRRLLRHLVEAQEMERRRIAWDVHDDSIQAMVAVGIRLQLLAKQVPDDQSATLLQLSESVRTAIFRLRNLVFRLQPPGIEREGLSRALAGYVRQVQTETGVEHVVHDNLDYEPQHDRAITAFRICQEALTNVRKHAEAHQVDITLDCVDDGILVRVDDDGVGISNRVDRAPGRDHFGVIEMRERAEIAGGWWTIRRRPEAGTTVEFWLPAPRSTAERGSP